MCGIAGFNLSPDEHVDPRRLAETLLLAIEHRGTDATGAAFYADGNPLVQKADMRASSFTEYLEINDAVNNVILHTRFATKGSPSTNANNHPIDVNGIVGVHNGMVWNDDDLFAQIGADKRIAQVDSEAIFASILHRQEKTIETLSRIEGSAAVAWFDSYGDPDGLHVARISSSPFIYAITEAGSFIFASTGQALTTAAQVCGMTLSGGPYTLDEGVYLRVRNGEIIAKHSFVPADRRWAMSETEKKALNLH